MSSTALTRLAAGLVVLLIAWGVLAWVRRPPADRSTPLVLARIDTAAVDSVVVARHGDTSVITRSAGTPHWRTNGFPAETLNVESLLKGLADTARTSELIAEHASAHPALGVAGDSGVHLLVYTRGASRAALDLVGGARTRDYAGVYVRPGGEETVYSLEGSLADSFTRAVDDWRDRRFVSAVPDSVARIEITRGKSAFTLTRSGKSWRISPGGRAADSLSVVNLLERYRDLRADGFPKRGETDSLDFARPRARVRLLGRGGAELVDVTFDSTSSGAWARRTRPDSLVVKMDPWLFGQLTPAESALVAKKK